jgi:hypothetical protein
MKREGALLVNSHLEFILGDDVNGNTRVALCPTIVSTYIIPIKLP